jgi:hypothetical protein
MITPTIDLDLVDQVVSRIPVWTWTDVKQAVVTNMVDEMPSTVLEQLTGSPDDFDRAEEILTDYYASDNRNNDLITDAFKILGEEATLYLLDALQLDKIQPPSNEMP